ncbi:hypothetical protein DFO66_10145 [Brevibacterium sanguinis]|uniref:Uncharacterized protein n=2 Tax=Brevibacterium TaxID=1696 RepID=A0A366INW5_9MICO|nr:MULTISPECIES: hypothetical protein [Brevibacterium]RBP67825.1 hypothetical protein DFO66_10145 [Brevibacterium sanguinis]RBP74758.1 hypothetical protein DFO65_101484 [Brevibacterium celere]
MGARADEIELIRVGPSTYRCEAMLADGGFAQQEHFAGTSVLPILAVVIAGLSVVALVIAVTAMVLRPIVARMMDGSPNGADRADRRFGARAQMWVVRLLVVACVLTPLTVIAQFLRGLIASRSGGLLVCPSTVEGEEVLRHSVESHYLPPRLTCTGETISGLEFTTTSYGLPFYGFLVCVASFAAAVLLVVVARVRARQPREPAA